MVDDNEDNRYTLTRRLTREGYTNLTTANDGRQALELLQSKKFDLMLLDIMMPEMNGYQVLEHLKADAELRHLPVIMISAVGEVESVVRCIELGAEDYLPNLSMRRCCARVSASLEKKKALRDEVREWNRKLEERVQEQVAQLNRLGRLKGFFSPQLAESIVNGGGEDLLKTHRREVVVVFLDLRGFTAFTDSSSPGSHGRAGRISPRDGAADPGARGHARALCGRRHHDLLQRPDPAREAGRERDRHGAGDATGIRGAARGDGRNCALRRTSASASRRATRRLARSASRAVGVRVHRQRRQPGLAPVQRAKGGQILINQKTLSRVEDVVEAEPLGEATLKASPSRCRYSTSPP
ncbi:MAG: response regulator [Betaproteobacteria bacterium]|nr:response regulator [Betaproteobacteria bacterium]